MLPPREEKRCALSAATDKAQIANRQQDQLLPIAVLMLQR